MPAPKARNSVPRNVWNRVVGVHEFDRSLTERCKPFLLGDYLRASPEHHRASLDQLEKDLGLEVSSARQAARLIIFEIIRSFFVGSKCFSRSPFSGFAIHRDERTEPSARQGQIYTIRSIEIGHCLYTRQWTLGLNYRPLKIALLSVPTVLFRLPKNVSKRGRPQLWN